MMRKSIAFLAAVAFVLGAAGTAGAALLNWSGTTTVVLSDLGDLPLYGGGVATVNDSSGGVPAHLNKLRLKASRGNVAGTQTVMITDPDTVGNSIARIVIEASAGTGTLSPISGAVANSSLGLVRNRLPMRGLVKICLLSTSCTSFLDLLLTEQRTLNGVLTSTVGVGLGGQLTVGGDSPIRISIEAAPWTIKTATALDEITTTNKIVQTTVPLVATGFAHGPSSGTTDTAQPSGVVQLVTPAQVTTNLPFGSSSQLGIVLKYKIHFIPEPGLLLLLGSGVAGLVLIARRKSRQ